MTQVTAGATDGAVTSLIGRMPEFDTWLDGRRDVCGKTVVLTRLDRAEENNVGDCESAADGLSEMRVFVRPGYRIYFVRTGITADLMLWGSDKTDRK